MLRYLCNLTYKVSRRAGGLESQCVLINGYVLVSRRAGGLEIS